MKLMFMLVNFYKKPPKKSLYTAGKPGHSHAWIFVSCYILHFTHTSLSFKHFIKRFEKSIGLDIHK